ncbi:MAG: TRAP transporter substrate-binding protein [Actinobacteria bacterium]|nr:TRAP transporter substrate-binding protein [Actinomycetota bacterium]
MKKFIIGPIICVLFLISTLGVFAAGENVISMRLASDQPVTAPGEKGFSFFADRIKEETNGQITITLYPNAVLGSGDECVEQAQAGVLEMAKSSCANLGKFIPIMDIFSIPYLFRDKDHYWKVLDGEVGSEIADYTEEAGMKLLFWVDAGARSFYNNVRPIHTPDDLKGLKIRVMGSDIMIKTMEAFGASPTTTAFSEVYSALQTGVIDGAENNPPSVDKMKHNEVAKYYSLDEHMMIPDTLVISLDVWNKLTKEQQDIFIKVSKETQEFVKKEWAKQEVEGLKRISVTTKINLIPDKSAFIEAVKPLQESLSPKFEGYIEKIQAVK